MSKVRHGVMALIPSDPKVSRPAVTKAAGSDPVDETESSLTFAYATAKDVQKAKSALTKLGLVEGETLFILKADIPGWLPAYTDAAASMVEHKG
jgi:hypothetical protein